MKIVTRTATQPSDRRLKLTSFNVDGRYSIDKVDIVELFLPVSWQQSKQVVVLKFPNCSMLGLMYINIFVVLDSNNRYVISISGRRLNFHGCWKLALTTAKSFP